MQSYAVRLNRMLDEIYTVFNYNSTSNKEVATRANLSVSTVWRIGVRKTKLPRIKSVMALANAAGLDLTLVQQNLSRRRTA